MKIGEHGSGSAPESAEGGQPGPKPGSRKVVPLTIAALVLIAAFIFALPTILREGSNFLSHLTTVTVDHPPTSTTGYATASPLIQGGAANITYPSDYSVVAAYAVDLINADRANTSLSPVPLSPVPLSPVTLSPSMAGQQHANSMLHYGYFSHYDTQGFAPYMRYSLLGGRGAVEENIAYIYNYPPQFTSTSAVEDAIKALEHEMINNDFDCCMNGHRDNILNSLHNRVSIGIAYNGTNIYFVEDFENYYINLDFVFSNTYYVTMTGAPLKSGISPNSIYVTYDNPPSAQTAVQLTNGPREYGPGNLTGGVLPPCTIGCPAFQHGITVYADTWKFTPTQVSVAFSLQEFIQRYHEGVYTIYLVTGSNTFTAITSISVFVVSATA